MCNILFLFVVFSGNDCDVLALREDVDLPLPDDHAEHDLPALLWQLYAQSHYLPLLQLLHQTTAGFIIELEVCSGVCQAFSEYEQIREADGKDARGGAETVILAPNITCRIKKCN